MVLGAIGPQLTEHHRFDRPFVASALITLMLLAANHVQHHSAKPAALRCFPSSPLLLAAIAAQVVFTGVKNFLIVG